GIEKMVGVFINTIPVRIDAKGISTFPQLVREVQRKALLTKSYEYLPLAEIQANSNLKGDLIDHIMIFENFPTRGGIVQGAGKKGFALENVDKIEHTNYDFNFITGPGNRYFIKFSFNGYVYDRNFIKNMELHFKEIITRVLDEPGIALKDISIVPAGERKKIVSEFNQTGAQFPADRKIQR
ncbi:MAG: hypothetical protein GY950_18880, partial [bacterium]|nr:hypothetical protein [bacterium]